MNYINCCLQFILELTLVQMSCHVSVCAHQVAVCNLASLALNRYVSHDRTFDFEKLEYVTGVIVRNLNRIIDVNYYPVPEVRHHSRVAHLSGSTSLG